MTRGVSLPTRLTAGIVLLLFLLLQTFGSKVDSDPCTTFCGNIYNISYPFRLRHQPPNCGLRRYNLSCEGNQTVLYLFDGKYYVQEINYSNLTIRIVESGIQKNNYSSIPRYFLNYYTFIQSHTLVLPYYLSSRLNNSAVAFLTCEKATNPPGLYLNKSTCFESGVMYSSNSALTQYPKVQGFAYVTYGWTQASDVDESCQVEHIVWTSEQGGLLPDDDQRPNFSCTDFHNKLAYGFQLRWFYPYCRNRCGKLVHCIGDDLGGTVSDRCSSGIAGVVLLSWVYKGLRGILRKLYVVTWERYLYSSSSTLSRGYKVAYQIYTYLYLHDKELLVQLVIILIDFGGSHATRKENLQAPLVSHKQSYVEVAMPAVVVRLASFHHADISVQDEGVEQRNRGVVRLGSGGVLQTLREVQYELNKMQGKVDELVRLELHKNSVGWAAIVGGGLTCGDTGLCKGEGEGVKESEPPIGARPATVQASLGQKDKGVGVGPSNLVRPRLFTGSCLVGRGSMADNSLDGLKPTNSCLLGSDPGPSGGISRPAMVQPTSKLSAST